MGALIKMNMKLVFAIAAISIGVACADSFNEQVPEEQLVSPPTDLVEEKSGTQDTDTAQAGWGRRRRNLNWERIVKTAKRRAAEHRAKKIARARILVTRWKKKMAERGGKHKKRVEKNRKKWARLKALAKEKVKKLAAKAKKAAERALKRYKALRERRIKAARKAHEKRVKKFHEKRNKAQKAERQKKAAKKAAERRLKKAREQKKKHHEKKVKYHMEKRKKAQARAEKARKKQAKEKAWKNTKVKRCRTRNSRWWANCTAHPLSWYTSCKGGGTRRVTWARCGFMRLGGKYLCERSWRQCWMQRRRI